MFQTPHLNPLEWLAVVLLAVGGINWGLVGLFQFDLVAQLFGEEFGTTNAITNIIYVLVGISALVVLAGLLRSEAMTSRVEREHGGASPSMR